MSILLFEETEILVLPCSGMEIVWLIGSVEKLEELSVWFVPFTV